MCLVLALCWTVACSADKQTDNPWSSGTDSPSQQQDAKASPQLGDDSGGESSAAESGSIEDEKVSARQVRAAAKAYIQQQTREGEGSLHLFDDRRSEDLSLKLVKVQRKVFKLEGRGLFVRAVFRAAEEGIEGHYELDFWVNYATDTDPSARAEDLVVTDSRIRSHPVADGSGWKREARYTFTPAQLTELK